MTGPQPAHPDVPPAIMEALAAQDFPRATALAREALADGIEHPLLLNLRAYWHEAEGRDAEAFADLARANELSPGDISILNALGLSHAKAGRLTEAIRCFDSIIQIQPDFGPAHFSRGWVSEDLGELDAARESFARAAALKPQAAEPWARLAALAARTGDWPAASENANRALGLDARNATAVQALANVELAAGDAAGAEKRLRAMLAEESLGPLDRANAQGLLGDALDRQDRTAEAIAAYAGCNAIFQRVHARRFSGPRIQTMPQYLEWLTGWFERFNPSQWQAAQTEAFAGESPRQHIFLLGFPRSGTTLLEEVFSSSPEVVATQERDGLTEAVRDLMAKPIDLERLAALRGSGLSRYRHAYFAALSAAGIRAQDRMLLDKQPYNTIKLPLIAKLFPEARIIFSIRDPRDVVLSCFRRRFRMNPSNYELLSLEGAAKFYAGVMRLAEVYRAKLPLSPYDFRYEDFVDDFEGRMRGVCDFAGLAWDDSMRAFAQRPKARAIATPSAAQINRGLNREGIGQWRRYREQMAPVLPILAPWVKRFGYPAD